MTGKTLKKLVSALIFLALAWAGGFAFFLAALPKPDGERPIAADGIVVYTGGGGVRISYAMGLLADGAGQRLLISGVHPDTSAARLSEFWVGPRERFDCCVDLGREALTTEGNADELKSWAETHRYKRIILVTSDYHMPRAVAVTHARMKGIAITPYAVSSGYISENGLPASSQAFGKLAGEYTKYLLARIKALIPANGR
ncbi:YdcF family protein [Hyphococcus luteus]|uniref:YdcF family protein n=1 Tax=Hyphococcus luteus TaxID=2058213 RepID=A0A2S7K618_9PROT|nr:YdcF family protein [Marinicaulis flavus]PQA87953.1 YdcF family protein [Marinicaulis flavus]